jgi:hypothetical protein
MPRALDPEQERVANLRRRAAMLARHAAARDPKTGKSELATRAGRRGGLRTVERHGSSSVWGLRMALRRHHGIALETNAPAGTGTLAKGADHGRDGPSPSS